MSTTPNFELPYILPSQAQKHVTHNEALAGIDALLHIRIESADLSAPPADAADGDRYVVGPAASGAWAGQSAKIAWLEGGSWRFATAKGGMVAWWAGEAALRLFDGSIWRSVGDSAPGSASGQFERLAINAPIDGDNRFAIESDTTLFSHETADHRLTINKAGPTATSSIVLQDAFSGRAEIGLVADDDFSLKVSPDGQTWHTALQVDRTSGHVHAPAGLSGPPTPGQTLQVAAGHLRTMFTASSTSPAPTGLAITLTPRRPNSTFFVSASLCVGADFWHTSPQISVYRDGAKIWPAAAGVYVEHQALADTEANSALISMSVPLEFLDGQPSDQPVTWEVRLSGNLAGRNVYLNRRHHSIGLRGESNMSVTEIAG